MANSEEFLDALTAVQEGDFETVQNIIGRRLISVNALDQDGCSLLHWAAINNRIKIARYLLESGFHQANSGGGVLGESPFQWAMRHRYYAMMDLLHERGIADIKHKSSQGSDALFLACKLGDVNAAFLVLHWGADVDTTDSSGDTPLLWLLRHRCNNSQAQELVHLLLRFGADATFQNSEGNSAMHVLADNKAADHAIAFTVFHAGGGMNLNQITNKKGWTPHTMSVQNENRRMARFLFDAVLFDMLPYWLPGLAGNFLAVMFYCLVHFFGPIYGPIYSYLLYMVVTFSLFQWQVVDHRGRAFVGAFGGYAAVAMVTYNLYIAPHLSLLVNIAAVAVAATTTFAAYKFYFIKPLTSRAGDRSVLARQIVFSAPSEGTEDETKEICRHQAAVTAAITAAAKAAVTRLDADGFVPQDTVLNAVSGIGATSSSQSSVASARRKRGDDSVDLIGQSNAGTGGSGGAGSTGAPQSAKFVKDSFTGQVRRVSSNERDPDAFGGSVDDGDGEVQVRCRTLGPRLCGECLCDKRCFVKHSLHPHVLGCMRRCGFQVPDGEHATTDTAGATGDIPSGEEQAAGAPKEVIAMATHCTQCNMCVVDMDHHSVFLGNCVGTGNRRYYWLFLMSSIVGCAIYCAGAKYVQQQFVCADYTEVFNRTGVFGLISREWCAFLELPAFYGFTIGTAVFGLYCFFLTQVQFVCIGRETTFLNVMKNRFEFVSPTWTRQGINLLSFIYTGRYNVHYPKSLPPTTIRRDSTSSNGSNGSNGSSSGSGSGGSSNGDSQAERAAAMQMLSDIDSRMGALESGGVGGGGAAREGSTASVRSINSTATYVAPTAEPSEDVNYAPTYVASGPYRSGAALPEAAWAGTGTGEEEDAYDYDFALSDVNTYRDYYFGDNSVRDSAIAMSAYTAATARGAADGGGVDGSSSGSAYNNAPGKPSEDEQARLLRHGHRAHDGSSGQLRSIDRA